MSKRFTIYGRLRPIESASLEIPLQRFQSAPANISVGEFSSYPGFLLQPMTPTTSTSSNGLFNLSIRSAFCGSVDTFVATGKAVGAMLSKWFIKNNMEEKNDGKRKKTRLKKELTFVFFFHVILYKPFVISVMGKA